MTIYGTTGSSLSWADACTKVRGDLWRPGTTAIPDDVCDRALHAALRRLESERRWMWLEQVPAQLTVATQDSKISAPASCQSISSIAYLSGQTGYDVLVPKPLAQIRLDARGTAVGWPNTYCLFNGVIYLDTLVPVGALFELIYKARTPDFDQIAAVKADPPFTLGAKQQAVLASACADISLGWLKDQENAQRHEARYQSFLEILMDEEDEARGAIHGEGIVPDTSLHFQAYGYSAS